MRLDWHKVQSEFEARIQAVIDATPEDEEVPPINDGAWFAQVVADQLQPHMPEGVRLYGDHGGALCVMMTDADGTILPPSTEGRSAFLLVADIVEGRIDVVYKALNGSWNHVEAVARAL